MYISSQKKIKEKTIFIVYIVLICLLTFTEYKDINKLFYLNDEWIALANIYANGLFAGIKNLSFFSLLLGNGRPLGTLLSNVILKFFTYNIIPFTIVSYTFHILNGLLTYVFVKKVSKNTLISFISGIFFITASVSHQAITWVANVTQVPISHSLLLVSLLSVISFIHTKRKRYIIISFICAYISYLFKDAYFYIFIFLPVFYLLINNTEYIFQRSFKKIFIFLPLVLIVIIYKISTLYKFNSINDLISFYNSLVKILFNSIFYPFVTLSHMFIPPEYMFKIAKKFLFFYYNNLSIYITNIDAISQNIISDIVSLLFSILVFIIIIFSYVCNQKQRKLHLINSILYLLSFVTISVYLTTRNTSYIESRYLYTSVTCIGVYVGIFIDTIIGSKRLNRNIKKFIVVSMCIVFLLFTYKQVILIQREVNRSVYNGEKTKTTLEKFTKVISTLPNKPVVYLTGNTNFYYYQNHFVPLELNPGYIFMVWLYKTGKIPSKLLHSNTLWVFGTQWYTEYENKAFGYYYDFDELKNAVEKYNIKEDQIIGLYFDGNTYEFKNITHQIVFKLYN